MEQYWSIGQHQSLPANLGGAVTTDGITEDLVVLLDEGSDPDPRYSERG